MHNNLTFILEEQAPVTPRPTMHITGYALSSAAFALLLFMYGFFPLKHWDGLVATEKNLPTLVGNVELNVTNLYQPVIGTLVIMVIDGLRWDFVGGVKGSVNMPYTSSLINNRKACHVLGKADPPTVTMPRIKAITTGTVPNFVDVLLNLGSSEILEDNLLLQASNRGWKMVFFGDDTWLKLFPGKFIRSDGTTSFFVSDFEEVDNNVTRHLSSELYMSDWKIMILHYLGLDHIGHVEGPRSSRIITKLQEMDAVVKKIHYRLSELDKVSELPSLLLVCGDHGMKESGSHGGASLPEVLVPIVMIGQTCSHESISWGVKPDVVPQIDLTPTLSVLLGLPIPSSNLGKVIPQILEKLPIPQQLYVLQYNAEQVVKQYEQNFAQDRQITNEYLQQFKEAKRLHAKWLRTSGAPMSNVTEIAMLYLSALNGISSMLQESLITFDIYAMIVAQAILLQIGTILILRKPTFSSSNGTGKIIAILFVLCLLIKLFNYCICSFSICNSLLCNSSIFPTIVTLVAIFIVALNLYFILFSMHLLKPHKAIKLFCIQDWKNKVLVFGSALHMFSLSSSSLIEEEHQLWYFLWVSFSLLVLYDVIRAGNADLAWQWFFLIALHRCLRKWNQTGDKFANMPDFGDWLSQPEQKMHLSVSLVLGLLGIYCCCEFLNAHCGGLNQTNTFWYRILWTLSTFYVYCYRGAIGSVYMPFSYPQSRGIVEVKIFWCIISILLFLGVVIPLYQHKVLDRNKHAPLQVLTEIVCSVISSWMFLCALLHRPHNVILLPAQVLISICLYQIYHRSKDKRGATWMCIVHLWLGNVFYFYQGNSNSLASIDIAAGYVGQEDYNPVTVGLLLATNTYSAHILSQLILVAGIVRHLQHGKFQTFKEWLSESYQTIVCLRVLPIAVYTIVMMFLRYHLFVWTVFSPKILYEAMHTLVTLYCMFLIQFIVQTVVVKDVKNQVSAQK